LRDRGPAPLAENCRLNIAILFGMKKLEWLGYSMVKNFEVCLFVLTEFTNVTDRQTHTDNA